MLRRVALAVSLLLLMGTATPALAQTGGQSDHPVVDALMRAMYGDNYVITRLGPPVTDPPNDSTTYAGDATDAELDLIRADWLELSEPEGIDALCDEPGLGPDFEVVCPLDRALFDASKRFFFVYALAGGVVNPQSFLQFVFAWAEPAIAPYRGAPADPNTGRTRSKDLYKPSPGAPFQGGETVYDGSSFSFDPANNGVMAIFGQDMIAVLMPAEQFVEQCLNVAVALVTQPGVADLVQLPDQPLGVATAAPPAVGEQPVETTAPPTEATSPPETAAPPAVIQPPATSAPAAAEETGEGAADGGFPWVLVGGGLLVLVAIAVWLIRRFLIGTAIGRETGAGGGGEEGGDPRDTPPPVIYGEEIDRTAIFSETGTGVGGEPGTGGGGEEGGDPRDTPPPVIYGEELDAHVCDWTAYTMIDKNPPVPIRTTPYHECCSYAFGVNTPTKSVSVGRMVRQDEAQSAQRTTEDRRRFLAQQEAIPHRNSLGLGLTAGARSGPDDDQSWMHALGESGEAIPAEDGYDPALVPLHEPADAAATASVEQKAFFFVGFQGDCPGRFPVYRNQGGAAAQLTAEYECTNNDTEPQCPVELAAVAHLHASSSGSLNYQLDHRAAGDVDELEALAGRVTEEEVEVDTPVALEDFHDHEMRSRGRYEDTKSVRKTESHGREQNWINTKVQGITTAGIIVPERVRDTTDRVTALVRGKVAHSIIVSGKVYVFCVRPPGMEREEPSPEDTRVREPVGGPGAGAAGGEDNGGLDNGGEPDPLEEELFKRLQAPPVQECCGGRGCLCEPEFTWDISGNRLEVDGRIWHLAPGPRGSVSWEEGPPPEQPEPLGPAAGG